jgi:hypothetical protein
MKTIFHPHKSVTVRGSVLIKKFISLDPAMRREQLHQILIEATHRREIILRTRCRGDVRLLSIQASEVIVLFDTMKLCKKILNLPPLH